MKSLIFSICAVFFVTFSMLPSQVNAQTTDYVWDTYGMKFSVPSSHQVKKSSADAFESGDSRTWLEIYPYRDASATPQNMVADIAHSKGFHIESEGKYNSGKYEGYWLRCITSEHPTWKFWVIGFIDPSSDVNFYSIIWWKKGDKGAYNQAYNMSYSFK